MEEKCSLYNEVARLVERAVCSPSKESAKPYLDRLRFLSNTSGLTGYANIVFRDLLSSVNKASGKTRDKEHWKSFVTQDLFKLESQLCRSAKSEEHVDE